MENNDPITRELASEDASAINCGPVEVTALKVECKEAGNPWLSARHQRK